MTITELLESIRKAAAGAAELAEMTDSRIRGTLVDVHRSLADAAGAIELELEDVADVA